MRTPVCIRAKVMLKLYIIFQGGIIMKEQIFELIKDINNPKILSLIHAYVKALKEIADTK